jgi:hypothetical protein
VDGSGRRPEDRRPAPSLSSGATPEYDRQPPVNRSPCLPDSPASPFGTARQASGRLPASSSIVAGAPAKTDSDRADRSPRSSAHQATGGRPPKRLHHPRTDGQRSRHEPQGPVSDRPERTPSTEAGSDCCRAPSGRGGKPPPTMPHPTDAGSEEPHLRVTTRERARGVELVTDYTQVT